MERLLIFVLAGGCAASPTLPSPQKLAVPARLGACPYVPESLVDDWDENEELWPDCPISSAVVSMGGRCLNGRYCMKPCGRRARYNGKLFAQETYEYEPTGQLRSGRIITILPNTGRRMAQSHVCTYDARAHRQQCTSGELQTTFTYEHGRLVASQIQRDDETLERRTHVYSTEGQLVTTESNAGTSHFEYNRDGSLATMRERSTHGEVTRSFSYRAGKLVRVEVTPEGAVTEYRYDVAGRAVEHVTRGPATEQRITFAYDKEGRLTLREWHEASDVLAEEYVYDCR